MDFSSRSFADVAVAVPAGEIDHSNAQRLQQALAPLLDALAQAAGERREERVIEILARLIPEFARGKSRAASPTPPSPSRGEGEKLAAAALSPSPLEGKG